MNKQQSSIKNQKISMRQKIKLIKKNIKTLVITGNGLDIYCGLDSKYSDYMDSKRKYTCDLSMIYDKYKKDYVDIFYNKNIKNIKYSNYLQMFINIISNYNVNNIFSTNNNDIDKLNIWEVILFINEKVDKDWYDIENTIKEVINTDNKNSLAKFVENINNSLLNKSNSYLVKLDLKDINNLFFFLVLTNILGFNYNKDDVFDFMMKQLIKLEHSFLNYINQNLEKHDKYDLQFTKRSNHTISVPNMRINPKAIEYTAKMNLVLNKLVKNEPFDMINFNYTNLYGFNPSHTSGLEVKKIIDKDFNYNNDVNLYNNNLYEFSNVNGGVFTGGNGSSLAYSDIIFGVDKYQLKSSVANGAKQFIKENRRKSLRNQNIFWPIKNIFQLDIKKIIFFGHSLSESDFSFFKKMFDNYNIYNNDSFKLVFVYALHGKNYNNRYEVNKMETYSPTEYQHKNEIQKEKQKNRIRCLMKKYDESNGKKDTLFDIKNQKGLIEIKNIEEFI